MSNPLNYSNPESGDKKDDASGDYLEIDTGQRRRWMGAMAYALFFLIVAGLLLYVFIQFTASVGWAVTLVLFMVSYMLIMGRWAAKDIHKRD
jgi:hypothetical protein